MLLRRHKINASRQSQGNVEPEKKQQDELYGDELRYRVENGVVDKEKYTKTDINKMPVSELRELAKKYGAENPEDMIGTDLKEYLISTMGL